MGIDWKKVFWIIIALLAAYWIISNPNGAAIDVQGIFATLKETANSIMTFIKGVLNG